MADILEKSVQVMSSGESHYLVRIKILHLIQPRSIMCGLIGSLKMKGGEKMGLHIPQNSCEIQTVKGVKYLVARLDDDKSVQYCLDELKAGKPTLVRYSSRGSLTTRLKREGYSHGKQRLLLDSGYFSLLVRRGCSSPDRRKDCLRITLTFDTKECKCHP